MDKPVDILPLGLYCAYCNAPYTGSEAQIRVRGSALRSVMRLVALLGGGIRVDGVDLATIPAFRRAQLGINHVLPA